MYSNKFMLNHKNVLLIAKKYFVFIVFIGQIRHLITIDLVRK